MFSSPVLPTIKIRLSKQVKVASDGLDFIIEHRGVWPIGHASGKVLEKEASPAAMREWRRMLELPLRWNRVRDVGYFVLSCSMLMVVDDVDRKTIIMLWCTYLKYCYNVAWFAVAESGGGRKLVE